MSSCIDNDLTKTAGAIGVVFLVCYFILCGDVELNPGPESRLYGQQDAHERQSYRGQFYPRDYGNDGQYDNYYFDRASPFNQFSQILEQAVVRMENSTRQQGIAIEKRLKSMEGKIDSRMKEIEIQQRDLSRDLKELNNQNQMMKAENSRLASAVNLLTYKCETLDNLNRRNNLVFIGIPSVRSESQEESEWAVNEVIYKGIGLEFDIHIDRVHRSGKVLIVTFQSQRDRLLVLKNAKRLNQSEKFRRVFIREDLSESTQEKRRQLSNLQRSMRQRGEYAVLRQDKLFTKDSVFTVDQYTGNVTQNQKRWGQRQFHSTAESRGSRGRDQSDDHTRAEWSRGRGSAMPSAAGGRSSQYPPSRPPVQDDTGGAHGSRYHHDSGSDGPPAPGSVLGAVPSSAGAYGCDGQESREGGTGDRGHGPPPSSSRGAASGQPSPVYNLRSRRRDNATRSADERVQAALSPTDPLLRGFGRGRGRTPPQKQRTIDSMWRGARDSRQSTHSGASPTKLTRNRSGRERVLRDEREVEHECEERGLNEERGAGEEGGEFADIGACGGREEEGGEEYEKEEREGRESDGWK
jgi:hypothetical protein